MSDWTVRPATVADAGAVIGLLQQFNLEESNRTSPLTPGDVERLGFGDRPRFAILVAEAEGRLVGYALYYPSFDADHAARGFYLQDLYVAPAARRRGVGRGLMAALARACREDGGCYLFWNALVGNRSGRAFYRAIGAREEPVVTLSLQPDALRRLAEDDVP